MRHNMHSSRTVLALLENSNMSLHAGDKGAPGVSSDAKMEVQDFRSRRCSRNALVALA
jgi:hypothetical protein